ncbi:hypothetical protein Tco_0809231 [Tanacetum coccineum]
MSDRLVLHDERWCPSRKQSHCQLEKRSQIMIVTTAGSSYNYWLELLLLLKIKVITTASIILVLPVQNVTTARRVSAVILS